MKRLKRILTWIESHKDLAAALQSFATIVAFFVGGLWTYQLASQYRETVPKLSIKQDVSSWILEDGSTLVRVDSTLTNSGRVQIDGVKGSMILWRLLPETKEQLAFYKANQMYFQCPTGKGKADPNCVPEQGLNLPDSSKHELEISDLANSLEPGESLPYWRYFHLDPEVKTIEVYTEINKPGKDDAWVFDSTFNLVRMPVRPTSPPASGR